MRATKRPGDERAKGRALPPSPRRSVAPLLCCYAFTLTELLVVIGIIVLMLALAVPAFNIIRGHRSVEGAENQLSALLARARTEAIGNQKTTGVFFFRDPHNPDVVTAAEVWQADVSSVPNTTRQVYLDLVPEREFLALTPGVGLQMVNDCNVDTTKTPPRQNDGYIGYNTKVSYNNAQTTDTVVPYGGVILFDSYGRLTCQTYGFYVQTNNLQPTAMGNLLYYDPSSKSGQSTLVPANVQVVDPGLSTDQEYWPRSQFGLVLFDAVAFKNAGGTDADPQLEGKPYTTGNEVQEEDWLDKYGTPLLVDRYNGTLNTAGQ